MKNVEVTIPDVGTVNVSKLVNCQGMGHPRPQLMIQKAIGEMLEEGICEILITDPPSVEAVLRVIAKNNSTLLGTVKDRNIWRIYFRKGK
jgi:TusA-related sulfurtransferase